MARVEGRGPGEHPAGSVANLGLPAGKASQGAERVPWQRCLAWRNLGQSAVRIKPSVCAPGGSLSNRSLERRVILRLPPFRKQGQTRLRARMRPAPWKVTGKPIFSGTGGLHPPPLS